MHMYVQYVQMHVYAHLQLQVHLLGVGNYISGFVSFLGRGEMFLFKIYADDKNTAGINIYIYVNMSMCMYMCARMFLFLLTIVLMFDSVFCSVFGFFFVFHKFT